MQMDKLSVPPHLRVLLGAMQCAGATAHLTRRVVRGGLQALPVQLLDTTSPLRASAEQHTVPAKVPLAAAQAVALMRCCMTPLHIAVPAQECTPLGGLCALDRTLQVSSASSPQGGTAHAVSSRSQLPQQSGSENGSHLSEAGLCWVCSVSGPVAASKAE